MKNLVYILSIVFIFGCTSNAVQDTKFLDCDDKNLCTDDIYNNGICIYKMNNKCNNTKPNFYLASSDCYGECEKTDAFIISGDSEILFNFANNGKIVEVYADYKCLKINSGPIVFGGYGINSKDYFVNSGNNRDIAPENSNITYKIILNGKPKVNSEFSCYLNFKTIDTEIKQLFFVILRA